MNFSPPNVNLVNLTIKSQIVPSAEHQLPKTWGLLLTKTFGWDHVKTAISKGSKMLGLIRRESGKSLDTTSKCSLYLVIFRSNVGYASEIKSPYFYKVTKSKKAEEK